MNNEKAKNVKRGGKNVKNTRIVKSKKIYEFGLEDS